MKTKKVLVQVITNSTLIGLRDFWLAQIEEPKLTSKSHISFLLSLSVSLRQLLIRKDALELVKLTSMMALSTCWHVLITSASGIRFKTRSVSSKTFICIRLVLERTNTFKKLRSKQWQSILNIMGSQIVVMIWPSLSLERS